MDQTMRCNNCNREVDFPEFMGYAGGYLLMTVGPLLITVVVKKLSDYITAPPPTTTTNQTRGWVDKSMAGFAKIFKIECPDCGECHWQAASTPKISTTIKHSKEKSKPNEQS